MLKGDLSGYRSSLGSGVRTGAVDVWWADGMDIERELGL